MPTRSCAGCRRRQEKSELLRLVSTSVGRLSLDAKQSEPGRGVYVCASVSCLARARATRGFARGLRRGLADQPVEALQQRLLVTLDDAARALREQARRDGRAVNDPGGQDGLRVVEPKCATQLERWAAQRAALAAPAEDAGGGGKGRRRRRKKGDAGGAETNK